MIPFLLSSAVVIALALLDRAVAARLPGWMMLLRHWATMILLSLMALVIILFWDGPQGVFTWLLMLVPLAVVGLPLVRRHRLRAPTITAIVMLAVALLGIGLASLDPGTLLHGDDHPLMNLAISASMAAVIAVVAPPPALGEALPDEDARPAKLVALSLPIFAAAAWIGLCSYMTSNARAQFAPEDTVCLRAPTGEQARHALGISPGALLSTNWRGMTKPWLLAGTLQSGWTYHWSFAQMAFVKNETGAFTRRSPGMISPASPAC